MGAAAIVTPGARSLPPRPLELRVGVVAYLVAAGLNVVVGAAILSAFPSAVARLRAQGHAVDDGLLVGAAVLVGAVTLAFSAVVVLLALRLRLGSALARPAVVTASILSLAAVLGGGPPALAVVVLLGAADLLVTRRPVTAWLRAARGLSPA